MSVAKLPALMLALAAVFGVGCRAAEVGTTECAPGRAVTIGCGCESLGECTGDPVLRVCDGTLTARECDFRNALAEVNDGPDCGRCASLTVTCPPSGSLLVVPRGFYPGELPVCAWEVRSE